MKKLEISIFTDEYKVLVFIGTVKELMAPLSKLSQWSKQEIRENFKNKRGQCFTYESDLPVIAINGDFPWRDSLATVAHEASHAMDWIHDYMDMDDKSGEFKAHGISCIVRQVTKMIKKL